MVRIIHENLKEDEIIIILKAEEWNRFTEIEKLHLSLEEIELIREFLNNKKKAMKPNLKTIKMKEVKLSAEWILDKMSMGWMTDGEGNVHLQVDLNDTIIGSQLVELALETIGVQYESETVGYDPDPEECEAIEEYYFKIADIREDCPKLWLEMDEQNEINRLFSVDLPI